MKVLSLLLSSLSISVGAMDSSNHRVLKVEDIPNAVKAYVRSTEASDVVSPSPFVRSNTSEECTAEESEIYTGTSIADAEIFTFLGSAVYNDPSFDMDDFFDSLNFDSECASLGGEVIESTLSFALDDFSMELAGFKLCMPVSCKEYEYFLYKNTMLLFIGAFTGMTIELTNENTTSMMCIIAQSEFYNGTAIENFAPETFLLNGGVEAMQESPACRQFSGKGDVGVCNTEELLEEYNLISTACEALEGKVYPLDMKISGPFMHYTIRKYPLCKPEVCSDSDILNYYDYVASFVTGEHYYGESSQIKMEIVKYFTNSCDESVTNKAFIKKTKGKVLTKSCKWLNKRRAPLKEKYCSKASGYELFGPASEVCPSSCCTCTENNGNLFLKKAEFDESGNMKIESQSCGWLKNASEKARKFQCGKSAASYIESLPPAYIACPQTCGGCE